MSIQDPSVQLRFRYDMPAVPQRLRLGLRGIHLTLTPEDGDPQRCAAYLQALGGFPEIDPFGTVLIRVSQMHLLRSLPDRVTLLPDDPTRTLLSVLSPSRNGPVSLTLDSPAVLNLSWVDATGECNEPLPVDHAAALLDLGVPISAAAPTWEMVRRTAALPLVRPRARVNLDGFVEISTTVPQQVLALDLPGLFVIDESRFGLPLSLADELEAVPGLRWEGPRPSYNLPPVGLTPAGLALTRTTREALEELTARGTAARGQLLAWPSGRGRRVFALAAVETLNAFPLLVLAPSSHLWLWRRHLDLLGRSWSAGPDGEVQLLPYSAASLAGKDPACIVFDELPAALLRSPSLLGDLRRFDGCINSYRLALTSSQELPDDSLLATMSLIRPVEFDAAMPIASRYNTPSRDGFLAHVQVYRAAVPPVTDSAFRCSDLQVLPVPEQLTRLLDTEVPASFTARRELVTEYRDVLSAGGAHLMGPKIPAALAMVAETHRRGHRAVLITGSLRTQRLLHSLTSRHGEGVSVLSPDAGEEILGEGDEVVVLDLPLEAAALERLLVPASDTHGPCRVTVLHLDHPLEDRLAVLHGFRAGRRAGGADLTTREIEYLLLGGVAEDLL